MRIAVRFRPLDVGNKTSLANVLVGKNQNKQNQKKQTKKTNNHDKKGKQMC